MAGTVLTVNVVSQPTKIFHLLLLIRTNDFIETHTLQLVKVSLTSAAMDVYHEIIMFTSLTTFSALTRRS